jgi:hypothetical protein
MAKDNSVSIPLPLRDDDTVVEVYADAAAGCSFLNGVFHLTFWALREDTSTDPPQHYRKITTRLAIPIAGARDLQHRIAEVEAKLRVRGAVQTADRPIVMSGPVTRQ